MSTTALTPPAADRAVAYLEREALRAFDAIREIDNAVDARIGNHLHDPFARFEEHYTYDELVEVGAAASHGRWCRTMRADILANPDLVMVDDHGVAWLRIGEVASEEVAS